MARYASDYLTGKKNLPQPYDAVSSELPFKVVMPAALASGDLLAVCAIPAGVQIVDYKVFAPQLDSNATPTLAFSIGVENAGRTDLATVFEASLIFGRTTSGSVWRNGVSVPSLDATMATAERVISLKVTTVAATAALAGKTIIVVLYLVN